MALTVVRTPEECKDEGFTRHDAFVLMGVVLILVVIVLAIWGIIAWVDGVQRAHMSSDLNDAQKVISEVYAKFPPSKEETTEAAALKQWQRVVDGKYQLEPSSRMEFSSPEREGTSYSKPGLFVQNRSGLTRVEFAAEVMREMAVAGDYYAHMDMFQFETEDARGQAVADSFMAKAKKIPDLAKDIPDPYAQ